MFFQVVTAAVTEFEVKSNWARICKAAKIKGLRIHDLRHSYASALVNAGVGLPVIGALLGHAQTSTTAPYSHLFDETKRSAAEDVGAMLAGGAMLRPRSRR